MVIGTARWTAYRLRIARIVAGRHDDVLTAVGRILGSHQFASGIFRTPDFLAHTLADNLGRTVRNAVTALHLGNFALVSAQAAYFLGVVRVIIVG